jgi:hypothetical protein
VKSFRYWRDPLCLSCCALYLLNRWAVKPHSHSVFLRGHFNDLLLIPCALPLLLWLQRKLGLRPHDGPPTAGEIAFHLAIWSVLFEVVGPHVLRVTGDALDVLAYVLGSVVAGIWWHVAAQRTSLANEL